MLGLGGLALAEARQLLLGWQGAVREAELQKHGEILMHRLHQTSRALGLTRAVVCRLPKPPLGPKRIGDFAIRHATEDLGGS